MMKQWSRKDEWTGYANCGGSIDHLRPASDTGGRVPLADAERVEFICHQCKVRPECIKAADDEKWFSVWVAGRYIPERKRDAEQVRQELVDSLDYEYQIRGEF